MGGRALNYGAAASTHGFLTASMRVSIVIPAFNEEQSLPDTIRAALAQDYPDFEVIVVNNASSDRTAEVAARFPVKLVHESRKGLLWARECGRQNASGDLIANMDADCLPDPGWISAGAPFFRNPAVVAVSGPYDYHDGGWLFRYLSLWTQKTLYWAISRLIQCPGVRQGAMLIGGNNLIRASALNQAGGYNTSILFYGEDTDTAKRVSAFGRVVFSNRLVMKTSARRFRAEGILRLEGKYIAYFFKTIFGRRKP
ncbi:MAG: glycosyltransferase family 2 protein [Verrucomicrobia bacterium]|nr:glycosyltransferase family 2 protein [Verrucomicrobiota bacterium]MDE3099805.1 glycosyltransferase family 2 protein [Verrucomicrobiota bacterium]